MKKVSIFLGLFALIGISSVFLIKNQNNNGEVNSVPGVISTRPQNNNIGANPTKFDPVKNPEAVEVVPNSNITVNRNIPSPDRNNRLPTIVRPTHNPQTIISPPPEAILMVECQSQSKGNPELMRKCFEAKINSSINAQVNAVKAQNNVDFTQQQQSLSNQQHNSIQQIPAVKTPKTNSGVFK